MFHSDSQVLYHHQQLAEILERVKERFQSIYQEELSHLVLFGSQARGDPREDSDIDVLVVLKNKNNSKGRHQKIIEFISDLCLEYNALVSCIYIDEVQFAKEESPLLINIRNEGIILL